MQIQVETETEKRICCSLHVNAEYVLFQMQIHHDIVLPLSYAVMETSCWEWHSINSNLLFWIRAPSYVWHNCFARHNGLIEMENWNCILCTNWWCTVRMAEDIFKASLKVFSYCSPREMISFYSNSRSNYIQSVEFEFSSLNAAITWTWTYCIFVSIHPINHGNRICLQWPWRQLSLNIHHFLNPDECKNEIQAELRCSVVTERKKKSRTGEYCTYESPE